MKIESMLYAASVFSCLSMYFFAYRALSKKTFPIDRDWNQFIVSFALGLAFTFTGMLVSVMNVSANSNFEESQNPTQKNLNILSSLRVGDLIRWKTEATDDSDTILVKELWCHPHFPIEGSCSIQTQFGSGHTMMALDYEYASNPRFIGVLFQSEPDFPQYAISFFINNEFSQSGITEMTKTPH